MGEGDLEDGADDEVADWTGWKTKPSSAASEGTGWADGGRYEERPEAFIFVFGCMMMVGGKDCFSAAEADIKLLCHGKRGESADAWSLRLVFASPGKRPSRLSKPVPRAADAEALARGAGRSPPAAWEAIFVSTPRPGPARPPCRLLPLPRPRPALSAHAGFHAGSRRSARLSTPRARKRIH